MSAQKIKTEAKAMGFTEEAASLLQQSSDTVAKRGITHRVYFKDVGGGKKSWEVTLTSLDFRSLLRAVKKEHAIGSRYPEFILDETNQLGSIFCGFRCCGTFSWTSSIEARAGAALAKETGK